MTFFDCSFDRASGEDDFVKFIVDLYVWFE